MNSLAKMLGWVVGIALVQSTMLLPVPEAAAATSNTTVTTQDQPSDSTADHTKFDALKGPFASGPELTKACLSCHTEAATQVQQSIHWTWEYRHPITGQMLGKKRVINSFCGNVMSNEPRCTSCHAGYGWEDEKTFDFKEQSNVDCVVCHDKTGTYEKWPAGAGHPRYEPVTDSSGNIHQPPDLAKIASSVGSPGRENCGACHFYGGGGDNVKHGDLSSALVNPSRHVDVHMSPDGADMSCIDCHTANGHLWPGSRYLGTVKDDGAKPRAGFRRTDVTSCQSCHTERPHTGASIAALKLNDHTGKVACQTCHIPSYAKGGVPTKTWWDWSTAGKLKDGKPYHESDAEGRHTYMSEKGDFIWEENVKPEYAFWNGIVEYSLLGDKIDPAGVVPVNRIFGEAGDPNSRIYPFKVMRGKQAYDTKNLSLVYTNVFGPKTDTALWTNFDWGKAITAGMQNSGVPYSGQYGFVETKMYWPTTHMVAPASEALDCGSCHAKQGRLAGLGGFYLPGRDGFPMTDRIGIGLLLLSLLGITLHAMIRLFGAAKRKQNSSND